MMSSIFVLCVLSLVIVLVSPAICVPLEESSNAKKLLDQEIRRIAKAAEMSNYMNVAMDPCDNFYEFACGSWYKINPTNSKDIVRSGFFETMRGTLEHKLQLQLKKDAEEDDNDIDTKVKKFYKSCVRQRDQRNEQRAKLLQIIGEFGAMPALTDNWNEENFDWVEVVAQISHKYGKDIIIGLDVLPDYANNNENRVYIAHPVFKLESRSMYLDEKNQPYRDGYKKIIAEELQEFLGMSENSAQSTAQDIVDFEISLARGMVDESLGLEVDAIAELTRVPEMQRKYGSTIDVAKLVRITLGQQIYDDVYEFASDYQRNLVDVIETTPRSTVANYIMYMLLDDFQMNVEKTQATQEHACMEKTKKYFSKKVDNMLYSSYKNNEGTVTERDVMLLWNELKQAFETELQSSKLDWLAPRTRQLAVEKLNGMRLEINSYATQNFTEEYADLQIVDDDYISNIKRISAWKSRRNIAELLRKPKPIETDEESFVNTPHYLILENMVKVPVSLLQPYYLWSNIYPNALKFATLGSLIGRELIKGFDDTGRQFDSEGNFESWWDSASIASFDARARCFDDQYTRYWYGGRNLPRSYSQSENIADNGGIRIAYEAYLKWLQRATTDDKLDMQLEVFSMDYMNYTSKQLFFISYAQLWCNEVHPRAQDLPISEDAQVPGQYRVIVPLTNLPEFSQEFNCAKGTAMNKAQKCVIY